MAFVTAKTILNNINILDPEDVKDFKKVRHASKEFQAFAYKLSKDLNDEDHLGIYMKLAKTMDRSLMERAYSFAIDSTSEFKGRVFLWKLKQLRLENKKIADKKNFTYDFVIKKMSKFRDKLKNNILDKSIELLSKESLEYLVNGIIDLNIKKVNILGIGPVPNVKNIYDKLNELENENDKKHNINLKLNIIEISKELTLILKTLIKGKVIYKDLLKNSFKDNTYDLIIINSYWQFIPLDSELTYLNEIKRILNNNGLLFINFKESLEIKECWNVLIKGNNELEYFSKETPFLYFKELVEKVGFNILNESKSDKYNFYLLSLKK